MKMKKFNSALAAPLAAFALGITVSGLALLVSGKNPLAAFKQMAEYGFTVDSVVNATNQAIPSFIAALAVAIGFKTNLFNIGVEGQYRLGAIFAGAVGANIGGPGWFKILAAILASMTVGAAYAGIAGLLKAYRNVNEVISTIMLNGVMTALVAILLNWTVIATMQNQQLRTPKLPESARFPSITIGESQLWTWLFIAILLGIVFHYLTNRSTFGFELRASGINPGAAVASGVSPKKMIITTMLISGAIAGMVGLPHLFQDRFDFRQDFPQGFGAAGIAVALVGRQKAIGMGIAAFLFAFIARSAQALTSPPTRGTPEIGTILIGTMMLAAVIAYEVVRRQSEAAAVREAAQVVAQAESVPA